MTELTLTGTSESVTPATRDPAVPVVYSLSTADRGLDQSVEKCAYVASNGSFMGPGLSVELDAVPVLAAGVAPEVSELAKRRPRLSLVLPRESHFSTGELRLRTSRDGSVSRMSHDPTPPYSTSRTTT